MRYERNRRKSGTILTTTICAVCFLAFCFLWLYAFQADVLAVAQHRLSGGLTRYDKTVGALLITLTLQLVQLGVYALTRLSRRTHALTYLPSFLLLGMLCGFAGQQQTLRQWMWAAPIVLVVWAVCVWLSKQLLPFENDSKSPTGFFSMRTWVNMAQMAAMMLAVATLSNTNAVYQFRAHAETALLRGDYEEAARTGKESHETDTHLTMLRAFALSQQHLLGEKFFTYPVKGTSDDLLPNKSKLLLIKADTIWKHLGGRPLHKIPAMKYYDALKRDSLATDAVDDYMLCSCLMDRDLKTFHRLLSLYVKDHAPENSGYDVEKLPHHYKEALILYQEKFSKQPLVFTDQKTEDEWEGMQQLKGQYTDPKVRRLKLYEQYRNNYWYYYEYGSE